METSEAGIDLIKRFEGCHKVNGDKVEAYLDPVGIATIGYGHTRTVHMGMVITREEAERLLVKDLAWAERAVSEHVKVPLEQNQFNCLVSLTFNIGEGAFSRSTLVRELNKGRYEAVPGQLMRWVYAGGKKFKGLERRRAAEAEMWQDVTAQPEDEPDQVPSTAEPDDGRPAKDVVRDSWTIRGLLLAALAMIHDAYEWILSWLGSGAEVMSDVNQTLTPWNSLLKVAGANMGTIAIVVGVVGLIIALVRRLQAGKERKEG